MERTIPMHKGTFKILWYDTEKDEDVWRDISGYTFSFIGIDFGCTQHYYDEDNELKTYTQNWDLIDLKTGQVCAHAVNRRAFSAILTPDFIDELKRKRAELYKDEN